MFYRDKLRRIMIEDINERQGVKESKSKKDCIVGKTQFAPGY